MILTSAHRIGNFTVCSAQLYWLQTNENKSMVQTCDLHFMKIYRLLNNSQHISNVFIQNLKSALHTQQCQVFQESIYAKENQTYSTGCLSEAKLKYADLPNCLPFHNYLLTIWLLSIRSTHKLYEYIITIS